MLSDTDILCIPQYYGGWQIEDELLLPECLGGHIGLWLVKDQQRHYLGILQELRILSPVQYLEVIRRTLTFPQRTRAS
jgi:uncharacterized membrane protein YsdA (DUF1294 family)